eukprot:Phypoly_transcript_04011.p1 GENE.Phypoly_transcript_04011~~Phypoly_transcript_04011.p1  ORF type:complete len:694 (+),score=60.30 Phypoly_transcript_04011:60-2141(+)
MLSCAHLALILHLVVLCTLCNGVSNTIRICGLIPVTPGKFSSGGKLWADAALAATDAINSANFIPGYKLEMVILDTKDTFAGTANASVQVPDLKCVGTIDVTNSPLSELAQNFLQNYKIPQVSARSSAVGLADKSLFPTLLRVAPSNDGRGRIAAYLVERFGWKKVAVIAGMDSYSYAYYQAFKEAINPNIEITAACFVDPIKRDFNAQVRKLAKSYTTIIFVFALVPEMQEILKEASAQGILGSPFIWIGNFAMLELPQSELPSLALSGNLVIVPSSIYNAQIPSKFREDHDCGYVFDAVYTYAYAFLEKKGSWENPEVLLETMMQVNFNGITGFVSFDGSGGRVEYTCQVENWHGYNPQLVGYVSWNATTTFQENITWSDNSSFPDHIPADSIIQIVNLPITTQYSCFFLVASLLAVELVLAVIYLLKTKKNKLLRHVQRLSAPFGTMLGCAAIITFIFSDITRTSCITISVLLDLSFLLNGGSSAFKAAKKLIGDYTHMAVTPLFHPTNVKIVLTICWLILVVCNLVLLVGLYGLYPPPTVAMAPLHHENRYELKCKFNWHFVALPASIGAIYLFALFIKLLNTFVNSSAANRKVDIFNTTTLLLTFLALIVALVFSAVITLATQNQLITICVVVILSGLSSLVNLLSWMREREERNGYVSIPPPGTENTEGVDYSQMSSRSLDFHMLLK